jgi:hypothetical protein
VLVIIGVELRDDGVVVGMCDLQEKSVPAGLRSKVGGGFLVLAIPSSEYARVAWAIGP